MAERLLDLAAAEGVDWLHSTILDPACGGGAFLVPVTHRILADQRVARLPAEKRLGLLESQLSGIEIDEFAAWMTRTLLQLVTHDLCREARRPVTIEIRARDAIEVVLSDRRKFDLVVGNPPYGRVQLPPAQRDEFGRSLYGHANLYGLFLDAALRWRSQHGLVAFVTPTSFLGGRYFHRLREVLIEQAPPLVIDILSERKGIFDAVQQETCLALFGPTRVGGGTAVHHVQADYGELRVRHSGTFRLGNGGSPGSPWLLPRTPDQAPLVKIAESTTTRLHHLGYKASTGPLVWNRHKEALRKRPAPDTLPLIWAEAVRPNRFDFEYRFRSHAPFFALAEEQDHLRETGPAVLVQRTTAKEQHRRLVACSVPVDFLGRWGGVVVENHVNVLRPQPKCVIPPSVLAAVLNTRIVDELFRCLSGTVAVSATELHALPLPPLAVFRRLEDLMAGGLADSLLTEIEITVAQGYGLRGMEWTG